MKKKWWRVLDKRTSKIINEAGLEVNEKASDLVWPRWVEKELRKILLDFQVDAIIQVARYPFKEELTFETGKNIPKEKQKKLEEEEKKIDIRYRRPWNRFLPGWDEWVGIAYWQRGDRFLQAINELIIGFYLKKKWAQLVFKALKAACRYYLCSGHRDGKRRREIVTIKYPGDHGRFITSDIFMKSGDAGGDREDDHYIKTPRWLISPAWKSADRSTLGGQLIGESILMHPRPPAVKPWGWNYLEHRQKHI